MRKIIISILILLELQVSGQFKVEKIKIGINSGFTFSHHEDLKTVNQFIMNQLPFEASIVDDFKPAFYFGAYSQYELFKRFYIGPVYRYLYTGSQLGARDYSGKYSFNQYLKAHQAGLKLDYRAYSYKKLLLNIELNSGVSFTDWKAISSLDLREKNEFSEIEEDKFKGSSWYITPALLLGYRIIPQICLHGSIGYSFDKQKNYYNIEDKDYDVDNTPDWSGIDLSFILEFSLK